MNQLTVWRDITPNGDAERRAIRDALREISASSSPPVRTGENMGALIVFAEDERSLDAAIASLRDAFGVTAPVGDTRVLYRQTVQGAADEDCKRIKQEAGRGTYAHVTLRVAPVEPGAGVILENTLAGGAIPREYADGVLRAIAEVLDHPGLDLRIELHDGSYHDVDSSEVAFRQAGLLALGAALKKTTLVTFEPIVDIVAQGTAADIDAVEGALVLRGARIITRASHQGGDSVEAFAALSSVLGFRAVASERVAVSVRLAGYERVEPGGEADAAFTPAGVKPRPGNDRTLHISLPEPEP